ncbi:MAG: ABC transporter permease [Desulfuromonadales bacterium]|jgi:putative ABC transport system permease protein
MTIPKLVIKNLIRKKGRFLFTLLGITIGIASFVTLLSLGGGLKKEISKQASDLGANLVVTPKGWCAYEQVSVLTGEQLPEAIPLETVRTIAAIPGLFVIPYLTERTVYQNNPISLIGILPEEMRRHKNWDVQQGRYFAASDEKVLVVGSGVASQFKFKPGDGLTIRGERLTIAGVLKETGGKDDIAVYLPLSVAQRLYGVGEMVSFIAIKVDDITRIDAYILQIQEAANVAVVSDKQLLRSVLAIVGTVSMTLQMIAAVAIVAAAFGIINTMMTAISERRREIGILQAIGAPQGAIFALFFLESGLYGLLGGIAGTVSGLFFSLFASPYIAQNEFTSLVKGANVATLDLRMILGSILFSVAVSLLSGLYPAWKAARLTPVEAITYE